MAHLHKGPWQIFDADWFKSHQSSLLSWLNGSWLKRKLSRHAFRIEATEPITEIAPSHYVVKLNDTQRRADFRTHPKYAALLLVDCLLVVPSLFGLGVLGQVGATVFFWLKLFIGYARRWGRWGYL
jgi:hypothetical protein